MTELSKPIEIGGLTFRNRALLAPMSGVTDLPMRNLVSQLGAGAVYSEMVASHSLTEADELMVLKAQKGRDDLHIIQLAGREAIWMERAAKICVDYGADLIDINMGCPARKVTTGYSGSALMRDLDHALTLVEATVEAVDLPVTLKMRLGWDDASINAPELAKRAESAGVQAITVHGRTRCQFYKGTADWNKIRMVREAITIPLIVNGDIANQTSAQQALNESGADGVMVGRAAYGKPWLPGLISGAISQSRAEELASDPEFVIAHHEEMLRFYDLPSGLRQARKHLGWYMDNLTFSDDAAPLKRKIMTSFEPTEIHAAIRELFSHIVSVEALPTEAPKQDAA